MNEYQIVKAIAREEAQAMRMSTTHCDHDYPKGQCARCEREDAYDRINAQIDDVAFQLDAMVEAGTALITVDGRVMASPEYSKLMDQHNYLCCDRGEIDHP